MRATGRQGRDGAEEGGGGPLGQTLKRGDQRPWPPVWLITTVQRQLWFTNPEDPLCVVYGEGSIIFQHGPLVLKID